MSPSIRTPEDVLALANVINPGGQRYLEDGTYKKPLADHEANCSVVAIATAAFLQDGTEVAAFSAPSNVMAYGVRSELKKITSPNTLPTYSRPFITTDFDATEDWVGFQFIKANNEDFIEAVHEILDQYPGHQFVVYANTGTSAHWFNITKEHLVIDIQSGLYGDQLLKAQRLSDRVTPFKELGILPVDKDLTGKQLISNLEGLHQECAAAKLFYYIEGRLDPEHKFREIIEKPDLDPKAKAQIDDLGEFAGQSVEWPIAFQQYLDRLEQCINEQNRDGHEEILNVLEESLNPDLVGRQEWLTDATYREPGSTIREGNLIEHFSGQVSYFTEVLDRISRNTTVDIDRNDNFGI